MPKPKTPAKKAKIDPKAEARAGRSFLIALRSFKVPETVAVTLARQAAEQHVMRLRRGDRKGAAELVSVERAEFLANELFAGLM